MKRWFTWPKLLIYSIVALLVAAWYVPDLNAERYREPILTGLENALGRKVQMGTLKFQLLPIPGFTIEDVIIGEDPAIGPEPIAYVKKLSGRPRFSALFGGSLEFASVDLEETSVNLTRVDSGTGASLQGDGVRWNFSSLVRPKLLAAFPSVHMIGGRVNFKFGETKSVFYMLNTDVDLWPPSGATGPWTLRVRAEPARTDRPSRGFGSFIARGEWHPGKRLVTLDVRLEKSELGDVMTLFEGRESSLHGHIWGDAHLAGPLSRVGLAGRLRIDDIHGWNMTPRGGSAWPVSLGGAIDVPGQVIDIRATTEGKQSPIDLRYRLADYLARPRWGVTAIFSQLPVAPLVGIARNLGWGIPPELTFDGVAHGALGYGAATGVPRMDGAVQIEGATLAIPGSAPLHVPTADVQFAGSTVTLAPVSMVNEGQEGVKISGTFDTAEQKLEMDLSSEGMALASLARDGTRNIIPMTRVPLLSLATTGTWSGNLRFSNKPEPGWSGDIRLKDADIPLETFSKPLHIVQAEAVISGDSVSARRFAFTIGGTEGQGDYRYEPDTAHPHKFRVSIVRAAAAEIESLLTPALRRGNFLNYAFSFGRAPEPDWLREMHADGMVQVGTLDLAGTTFTKMRTRVLWDGDQVRLIGLQANLHEALFAGSANVNLKQREPRYLVAGSVAGFPWRSGTLDADGTLEAAGTGTGLLSSIKAGGKFTGLNLDLAPSELGDRVEGSFEWAWDAKSPRLKLGQLVMKSAAATYQGSADTQNDGQLVLRVTDGTKQIQASGALLRGEGLKVVTQ